MKKVVKKLGRVFIALHLRGQDIIKRTALIVDSDSISQRHLNLVIGNTARTFTNTHTVLLTFLHRKKYIGDEFAEVELIYPSDKNLFKRYKLAKEIFKLRNRNFDFIILTSLDITPMLVAIFFTRAQVWLYNQWDQWWSLRQRTVGDLIKIPAMFIWFIFLGARNTIIFLYLLFSVGFFWLRRFLPFRKA